MKLPQEFRRASKGFFHPSSFILHPFSPGLARALALAVATVLAACSSAPRAPVIDRAAVDTKKPAATIAKPTLKETDGRPEFYAVKKGDTLFAIALEHGLDYKELAEWNGIENPNVIRVGQQLRLSQPSASAVASPISAPVTLAGKPVGNSDTMKSEPQAVKLPYSEQTAAQAKAEQPRQKTESTPQAGQAADTGDDDEHVNWAWPANGKVLNVFSESTKGVDIGGKHGQPVYASAPGKVVYSGPYSRYGKLIVIKHNKTYFSVYAHNDQVMVKEGQTVAKGQKIAEMGNSDTDQVKLHFEIRRLGKPVDPMKFLPNDKVS